MSYNISASAIKNLDHELDEIRVRTLKHIEGKILRAFQQDATIDMNSGKLMSKLINWFNKKPLLEVETVLNLILTILKSEFIHETVKFLKKSTLEKEVNKIYEIVKSSAFYKEIVQNIKELLENYEEFEKYTENDTSSLSLPVTGCSSDNISIQELGSENNDILSEYEQAWSTPSRPDLNQMNMIFNSLSTISTYEEVKNGLEYFKTAVNDYPVEYFLQPPYIVKNMIKLYFQEKKFAKLLILNFNYLSEAIKCRIRKRVLSECYDPTWKENTSTSCKIQISLPQFCVEILKLSVEHLKAFDDAIDQNEIFDVYQLIMIIFEIMELVEYKKNASLASIKSILIDLGILARFYRQEKMYRTYRIQYIYIISIIAKLVKQVNHQNENIYKKSIDIWHIELENAILDFPLRQFYPLIYNQVEEAVENHIMLKPQLNAILNCHMNFTEAIDILKRPEEKTDVEFIQIALKALDTLSIHVSLGFVRKIIKSISSSIYLFDGKPDLKSISEEIVLRLLAHENVNVQRVTYQEISNNMKKSFGCLMNGNVNIRNFSSNLSCPKSLGIPLTSEIISEIICFGYFHQETRISKNAEIILSLILKGKDILGSSWNNILQILIPNFPLLQTLANCDENFGKLILELFNPDNGLDTHELLKGNLRFLFSTNYKIRSEAVSRLVYILAKDPMQYDFLPNISEISDIIPDNICYIQVPRDPEKIFYGGLYDFTTIPALLELLKSSDVEPNVRKTCLMQLNVLCQDIDMNKIIFKDNGWYYSIQALENSLKKNPTVDYTDSLIPAVGMLSKILLCNAFLRNELSGESNIYLLLLRSLFLFYNDITLQQDAVITLFLLLYNHHIVGGEKKISVPIILKKINLPLKSDFHWEESIYKKVSYFEQIFLEISENNTKNNSNFSSNTFSKTKKPYSESERFSSIPLSRRTEPIYSVVREKQPNENEAILQFIRYSFSTIWFTNFEEMHKNIILNKLNNDNTTLDYTDFPENFNETSNGIIEFQDILDFNSNLKINSEDIRLIKITSPQDNVRKFLKKISNETTENDFLKKLAEFRFCLFLGSYSILDGNEVIKTFQRFLIVKPSSTGDHKIFQNIVDLFHYLIKLENESIILWILKEFSEQNCVILQVLKDYNVPRTLYDSVCELIETIINFCSTKANNNKIQEYALYTTETSSKKYYSNIYNKLFEIVIPIAEECFHKRYLDQVRSLLNLLQIITKTENIDIDYGFATIVIKKMLYFVMALKLFTQCGSHLNKNCLLIVGNLMNCCDEIMLDENHVKLLSGLCSHEDFEIRALSWGILTKISISLKGSHLIVKELSYLPGGFHACCLSTLLDNNEIPLVRFAAGMLFSNLLSHKSNDTNGTCLHLSVAPLCIELEPSQQNNGLRLITKLFSKYSFYSAIQESIEHIHIARTINSFKIQNITTCSIINAYCRILSNFIDLCPESEVEIFDNEPFIIRIFNLIKLIPSCITDESLWMFSEICFIINKFLSYENITSIKKNMCSDYGFIVALNQLLNLKYFEKKNPSLLINPIQTLRFLINDSIFFEIFCEILSSNGALNIIEINFENASLTLLITLLAKSYSFSTNRFKTIPIIFDSTELKTSNQIFYGSEQIFYSASLLFNKLFQKKTEGKLFKKTLVCEALAALLRTSPEVRKFAHNEEFLSTILHQIDLIYEDITVTSTEYIRNHGDSKKIAILRHLTILFSIILYWFSSDCLKNQTEIEKLSKTALHTWQWINHSESLREVFLKTLVVLSKDSLEVCKQFAASITSFSNSIMQLTCKMVIAETNKIRHPNIDFGILELGLGILTNCCTCIEGRLLLVKMNLLDVISNFHPMDVKIQKSWNVVTIYWLEFWSTFSIYQEGAVIKHLYILCSFITKTKNKIRLLCLIILRNMAFLQANGPGLLSSQDFQYVTRDVLESGNEHEKFIIVIALWKLISKNFKARHVVKSWGIPMKLKNIQREIDKNDTENDLYSAIEIVLNILK
ncbi:protein rotatin homolog [Condylostylus longicornis]|uniref:protein rotatin homolog n=1 Tax=Condylostylus longicornis TaxID=2530218 RepID=UPI00244DE696|nr:protein rotatin homolog [Condylostylus longicornis]